MSATASPMADRQQGRLKIFLGAAPGVGKTYAMLRAAQLRQLEGVQVVVGIVETHGRSETEALRRGLPQIPPRLLTYRGIQFAEMDLDAVLARRPPLVLVDELAHTNIPGSRHPKRYLDVLELLEAGIDVYSTLNVQHIDSLNDVITQITGVAVRETVPDTIIQRADAIELIDLPPEDLLQRLREGKVYLPEQARRAMAGFFTQGNLTALRELALRLAAERVDAQMLSLMQQQGIATPWPTRDRILVCIGSGGDASYLVRTSKRVAQSRHAPWIAAHVETPAELSAPPASRRHVAAALKLATELGAETVTLSGDTVAREILELARSRNVSRIIIGRERGTAWWRRWHWSTMDELINQSEGFEIQIVTAPRGDPGTTPAAEREQPTSQSPPAARAGWRWLEAPLAVAAASLVALALAPVLNETSLDLAYLVAVLVVAVRRGLWPSLLTAGLGFVTYKFLFVEPRYSFAFADGREWASVLFFLATALVSGNLAGRLRERVEQTRQAIARTTALLDFSRALAVARTIDEAAQAVVLHTAQMAGLDAALLLPREGAQLRLLASMPASAPLDAAALAAADWCWRQDEMAGLGSHTLPEAPWLFLPLRTQQGMVGVLGIRPRDEQVDPHLPALQRLLTAIGEQAATAIQRTQLARDIEHSRLETETERLRGQLLSAVSQDLLTPLTAIMAGAGTLRHAGRQLDAGLREALLDGIEQEAERLNHFLQNLIDMTRISAGALPLRREWVDVADIVAAAARRLVRVLARHPLVVRLPEGRPLLFADGGLLEQVMVNLLDNAAHFAPPETPILVTCNSEGPFLEWLVADEGPGIPPEERERVFDLFYRLRLPEADGSGPGLGLAICRGIIEAHGGTIRAAANPQAQNGVPGTSIIIRLPVERPALSEGKP